MVNEPTRAVVASLLASDEARREVPKAKQRLALALLGVGVLACLQTFSVDMSSLAPSNESWFQTHANVSTVPLDPDGVETHACQFDKMEHSFPLTPNFLLIGAQKSGTTALAKLLERHDNIVQAVKFEPHFFDFLQHKEKYASESDFCELRFNYTNKYFDLEEIGQRRSRGDLVRSFEKTPDYLPHPKVPALVNAVCPWKPKILVSLRNPVDRVLSYYRMEKRMFAKKQDIHSFEDMVYREIEKLRKRKFTTAPNWNDTVWWNATLEKQQELFALPKWKSEEERERITSFVAIYKSPVVYGMYAQQLSRWIKYFPLGPSLKVIRYESFKANRTRYLDEIFDFVGVPGQTLSDDVLESNLSPHFERQRRPGYFNPIHPQLQQYLRLLYKPYNDELADLLGEDWRDVW